MLLNDYDGTTCLWTCEKRRGCYLWRTERFLFPDRFLCKGEGFQMVASRDWCPHSNPSSACHLLWVALGKSPTLSHPYPRIKPGSPTLQADALLSEPPGKLSFYQTYPHNTWILNLASTSLSRHLTYLYSQLKIKRMQCPQITLFTVTA